MEPLPNLDFNIMSGNSLIGLLHINEQAYDKRARQPSLIFDPYSEVVRKKNKLIDEYKEAPETNGNAEQLRDEIQQRRGAALRNLNELLLNDFWSLGIKYEEATWDPERGCEGKPRKRAVQFKDIEALSPFHWGFEFSEVIARGGFDVIITNPPWEAFKPQAKEFFALHSGSTIISKNKMRFEDFQVERESLLADPQIRGEWLEYQSAFPIQSAFFRAAPQYTHQVSTINGKRTGTDINFYKVFTEQCYNLLRPGGMCGIVLPSGIYTDQGAKGLREMLIGKTEVTGLFGFENRRGIFEDIHRSFKFVVLTFDKGGQTPKFFVAFMRHNADELGHFPRYNALEMPVELYQPIVARYTLDAGDQKRD